ncbi:hypothetical protein [Formosa algae]|uniref:hypothetical protein n=1 Tax=Formosa algae TaxID=225843 RepID=UPI000CCDC7D5|nr:hypothetical protein [Formosa algae]PNW29503.1 hypothetical protein BKP44_04030 [Formosa algae]
MKKTLVLLLCILLFVSCKSESKSASESALAEQHTAQLIQGDFVYYADAAVLQTKDDIYGVIINAKMHELNTKVKVFKKEDTDMVPVQIKGIITTKPEGEEGWPLQIEITDIITVSQPKAQDENTIKI